MLGKNILELVPQTLAAASTPNLCWGGVCVRNCQSRPKPGQEMAAAVLSPEVRSGGACNDMGDELLVIRRWPEKGGFEGQLCLNGSHIPNLLYADSAGAASPLWVYGCCPWRGDACGSPSPHNPSVRLTAPDAA